MTSKAFGLAQLGNAFSDGALSNRNLIINGAMQVAQRGTSVSNSAGGYTTVDRFFQTGTLGGTFAWEKSSDAPTEFSSSFKSSAPTGFSSLSSAASARIGTAFEGQDLQQLLKGTSSATDLTLSFWVKATVAGTYIVELYDTDNTRNICQSYTISASNTWQKVVMTFAGDTSGALDNDNAASLVVHWFLAAGSDFTSGALPTSWQSAVTANRAVGQVNGMASNNDAFYLTGVQLEVGDTATPFEHRSFGAELALCQRYFQSSFATGTAPATGLLICMYVTGTAYSTANGTGLGTRFPVDMRSTPTMAYYPASPASGSVGTVSIYNAGWTNRVASPHTSISPTMQAFDINASGAFTVGPFMCQYNYTANAEL
jgi:hypothetical protein